MAALPDLGGPGLKRRSASRWAGVDLFLTKKGRQQRRLGRPLADSACRLAASLADSACRLAASLAGSTCRLAASLADRACRLAASLTSSACRLPSGPAGNASHLPSGPAGNTSRLAASSACRPRRLASCLLRRHSFPRWFRVASVETLHFLQTLPPHMTCQLLFGRSSRGAGCCRR